MAYDDSLPGGLGGQQWADGAPPVDQRTRGGPYGDPGADQSTQTSGQGYGGNALTPNNEGFHTESVFESAPVDPRNYGVGNIQNQLTGNYAAQLQNAMYRPSLGLDQRAFNQNQGAQAGLLGQMQGMNPAALAQLQAQQARSGGLAAAFQARAGGAGDTGAMSTLTAGNNGIASQALANQMQARQAQMGQIGGLVGQMRASNLAMNQAGQQNFYDQRAANDKLAQGWAQLGLQARQKEADARKQFELDRLAADRSNAQTAIENKTGSYDENFQAGVGAGAAALGAAAKMSS